MGVAEGIAAKDWINYILQRLSQYPPTFAAGGMVVMVDII